MELKIKCKHCNEVFVFQVKGDKNINIDKCPLCEYTYEDPAIINDFIDKIITYNKRHLSSIELQGIYDSTISGSNLDTFFSDIQKIGLLFDSVSKENKQKYIDIIDLVYLIMNRKEDKSLNELRRIINEFFLSSVGWNR